MTHVFWSLKSLLTPKRPSARLLDALLAERGITKEDLQRLRALVDDESWNSLLRLLDARVYLIGEGLLSPAATSEELHFQRGRAAGLRELPVLVVETLHRASQLKDMDDQRSRAPDHAADGARIATFATPYFDRTGT